MVMILQKKKGRGILIMRLEFTQKQIDVPLSPGDDFSKTCVYVAGFEEKVV